MTNDIRESLARLQQLSPVKLDEADAELSTLLSALREDVKAHTLLVAEADPMNPAYAGDAADLAALLELTSAVVAAKTEVGKLTTAAGKAIQRVLKKAPK